MNVLHWGPDDFPLSYVNRDISWNACYRHSGSFMVDIYGYLIQQYDILNLDQVTSQLTRLLTNIMTLIPSLTFTELRVLSMEHLQRVWHANRKLLPFRTPGFVPFWDLLMLQLLRPVFPNTDFPDFSLWISLEFRRFCLVLGSLMKIQYYNAHMVHIVFQSDFKRKRKLSDPVLWQTLLHSQKNPKINVTT